MRKGKWKEYLRWDSSLGFIIILVSLISALALTLFDSLPLFVIGVAALTYLLLVVFSHKAKMQICSCGAVFIKTRCPNCGTVCSYCGKKY